MEHHIRAFSSPLLTTSSDTGQPQDDCGVEGLATNIKLLLKLIQEHNGCSAKDNYERKCNRVNGMMFILDEARSRVQKVQSSTKRKAELRRCNTDLRPKIPAPKDKRIHPDLSVDEKEKLRKELNASLVEQQSLQAMCSSLGKEKQIMASELARKAQELAEMEEFIGDLKARNDTLLERLHAASSELKEKKNSGIDMDGNITLQARNKALTEQLQKSIDGYRSLKRKLRDIQEENKEMHATMEQMEVEVREGIDRIHGFKEEMVSGNEQTNNIQEEISALEHMLESLNKKISKYTQKKT
ncbi:hypothetical protein TanjilG_05298 [Lupinus angustifolius]|uniref:Uncharacterized protein n=1 Tax=Lupinus angustifolius TaxID=3871 RepID=A0A4P1QVK1_LUPAN|nr:PREDICTED: uncharacterized protein LOC109329999 [Lupinus angustifolius]XP_019419486.1 PREDICTED: uncharacterized protein LOC109329999 [Lupinus angustifolius]OIV95750.1 hypothetical protein TanjilG_05298 [Lupinus angustifolius]